MSQREHAPTRRVPGTVRRGYIAAAARGVFLEHGLAGARTREIADAAGVAEAMLYRHYSSKEEIFEAAILEPIESTLRTLVDLSQDFALLPPRERLDASVGMHRELLDTMTEILPLLGMALYSDVEMGRRFFKRRLAPMLQQFYDAVEEGTTGWEHRPMDAKLIAMGLLGWYSWIALDANFAGSKLDSEEINRTIIGFFDRGIRLDANAADATS